jgi:hypothetical protein
MGGFDVGSRGRVKDFIGDEGARKDAKYINKKIDDFSMVGAELMDKLGWTTIWKAVKAEVAAEQKLTPGTEKFFEACKVRFTEVVTKTQVFDSVASRSGYMRSQHDSVKFATSFMGEPTAIVGRFFGALSNLARAIKSGNKTRIKSAWGRVGRTTTVLAVSGILGNLAVSLVYAGRDDEDDEAFLEKMMKNFASALSEDLNILTYLPFGRDIVSVIDGWDVERPDMTLIADVVTSVKKMIDGEVTLDDSLNLVGSVGNFFGKPLKNVIREIKSAMSVIDDIFIDDIYPTDVGGAFIEGFTGEEQAKIDSLYDAMIRGDKGKVEAIEATYKSDSAFESAVRKALADNDYRIIEAVIAHYDGDSMKRASIVREIVGEGIFEQNIVQGAVNGEIASIKTKIEAALKAKNNGDTKEYEKIVKELCEKYPQDFVEELIENTTIDEEEDKDDDLLGLFKMDDYFNALVSGNASTAYTAREDIINTAVANGKSRKDAEEDFTSSFRSHVGRMYKSGEISRSTASNMLTNYGGYDSNETYWKLKEWDFRMANGEDASYSKYTDFYEAVKTGSNIKAIINEYLSHGIETKTLASQITSYYKPLYIEMSNYERASLKGYLLNAYVLLGYNRYEKSRDIDKWLEG